VKIKLVGKAQPLEVAQVTEKVVADASEAITDATIAWLLKPTMNISVVVTAASFAATLATTAARAVKLVYLTISDVRVV